MLFKKIIRTNNLRGFKKNIFYCGLYKYQEETTFICRYLKIFKSLFGINKACFIHDKHYNLIFRKSKNILQLLIYKFFVDVLFLINMIKYLNENKESKFKKSQRILLSVIFFIIVLIFTPYYIKLYYKKK